MFQNGSFYFFGNFCGTKFKLFLGNARLILENGFNLKFVLGSVLGNGLEPPLRSEKNVLSNWKWHFSLFYKILIDEVKVFFLESEAKPLFKFKSLSLKHSV